MPVGLAWVLSWCKGVDPLYLRANACPRLSKSCRSVLCLHSIPHYASRLRDSPELLVHVDSVHSRPSRLLACIGTSVSAPTILSLPTCRCCKGSSSCSQRCHRSTIQAQHNFLCQGSISSIESFETLTPCREDSLGEVPPHAKKHGIVGVLRFN